MSGGARILVVRMSAMGDIVHALPAAASLKHSFPNSHLTWVVDPRWAPLLDQNPFIDMVAVVGRGTPAEILRGCRTLRAGSYDLAVDFQGLFKSAVVASLAQPDRLFGFHQSLLREKAAAIFYSHKILSQAAHVVDQNLDLAAGAGAGTILRTFPLPHGEQECELPQDPFVLTSPLAGWRSKQWPADYFTELAALVDRELGMPLVLDWPAVPGPGSQEAPRGIRHTSGIPGLIYATRRAAAVVGVDSGPLHLAAALGRPGVAIFGPTDPARNGPYGGSMTVLRSPRARTSYKRGSVIDASMRDISPAQVLEALKRQLAARPHSAGLGG